MAAIIRVGRLDALIPEVSLIRDDRAATPPTRHPPWLAWALLSAMMVAAVILLSLPLYQTTLQHSTLPNEGWNAFLALRLVEERSLYPGPGELIVNNYPPLSFAVLAPLGQLLGDQVMAGRLVTLASVLVTAVLIARLVQRCTGAGLVGWLMVFYLLGYEASKHISRFGANDPQWLGHALMTGGIFLLLSRWSMAERVPLPHVLGAVLLVLAGGFAKHSLLAVPLAITIWLALYDRRGFLVWAIAGLLSALLGLALAEIAYPGFLASVLGIETQRGMDVGRVPGIFLPQLTHLVPAIAITAWGYWRYRRAELAFALIYAAISLVIGVFFLLGSGVSDNVLYDANIAATLGAGMALGLAWTDAEAPRPVAPIGMAALLAVIAWPAFEIVRDWPEPWRRLQAEAAGSAADIALVASVPGQAVCETPSLCYWAGKPFILDMFNIGERLRAGSLTMDDVLTGLRAHDVQQVQLERSSGPERVAYERLWGGLPPALLDKWLQGYNVVETRSNGRVFMRPARLADDGTH